MEKGVVYGGESAGVVCQIKDLKAIGWLDKPEESPEPIKEGLNFTNIVALPHWNNPKYKETLIKVKDYYEDKEIKVHTIEDGQAIFVDGKKITKFE
jgi:peptidase E